jgi:hypothetical protein
MLLFLVLTAGSVALTTCADRMMGMPDFPFWKMLFYKIIHLGVGAGLFAFAFFVACRNSGRK